MYYSFKKDYQKDYQKNHQKDYINTYESFFDDVDFLFLFFCVFNTDSLLSNVRFFFFKY